MSLGKFVTNQLYQIYKDKRDVAGRLTYANDQMVWAVAHEGRDLALRLQHCDRHSAELLNLEVRVDDVSTDDTAPSLPALSEATIESLNYLEEPLAVWELDEREQVVQLRSMPPQYEDEALFYWEVEISQRNFEGNDMTTLRMGRYHWQPGLPEREQVPYPVTYTLLGRITESLAQVLAGYRMPAAPEA